MLIKADVLHASPFAHLATPIEFDLTNHVATNLPFEPETWEQGITHVTKVVYYAVVTYKVGFNTISWFK